MTSELPPNPLEALYQRPGFKIRRAHQIAVSLFEEKSGGALTQPQYGVMVILSHRHSLDQIGLAKLIGLDRSTTALVLRKLEASGYVERRGDPGDRRRKLLALTAEGQAALERSHPMANAMQAALMSVFTEDEAREMHRLLSKLVDAFNDKIRTPIATED